MPNLGSGLSLGHGASGEQIELAGPLCAQQSAGRQVEQQRQDCPPQAELSCREYYLQLLQRMQHHDAAQQQQAQTALQTAGAAAPGSGACGATTDAGAAGDCLLTPQRQLSALDKLKLSRQARAAPATAPHMAAATQTPADAGGCGSGGRDAGAGGGSGGSTGDDSAAKPFLKRRSQRVHGCRLDWSGIGSKTVSRLDDRRVCM